MRNRLKVLRKEKGLTQADLAKVLNTNQSQYGKYENGKTNLSIENAKIFADYFGVSVPYLIGLDDNSNFIDPFEKTPNRIGELINSSDKSLKQISHKIEVNRWTIKLEN